MLLYFLTTRIVANAGQLLLFVYQFVLPSLAVVTAFPAGSMSSDHATLPALVRFLLCYETGYLFNDGIDNYGSRRSLGRTQVIHLSALNALMVAVMCTLWQPARYELGILLATILLFLAHNNIFPARRLATFFLLNFLKMSYVAYCICGPVLHTIFPITIALALPLAWKYAATKRKYRFVPSAWLAMSTGSACLLFVTSPMISLGALLVLALAFALSFVISARRARHTAQSLISHAHTALSHDGTLMLSDYSVDGRTVFLTDHAEDVSHEDFSRLMQLTRSLPKFLAGLEYPYFGQHVLAVGLRKYYPVDAVSLSVLRVDAEILIWAHPDLSIRELLTNSAYRQAVKSLFIDVDGIEVFNVKAARRGRRQVHRILLWAALFCFLKGCRSVYWALDAHHRSDLATVCKPPTPVVASGAAA